MIWLHSGRRLLGFVTMSGVARCTFGRRACCRLDVRRDSLSCRARKWCTFRFVVGENDRFGDYIKYLVHVSGRIC